MIGFIVLCTIVILAMGYRLYGRFISRKFELDDSVSTMMIVAFWSLILHILPLFYQIPIIISGELAKQDVVVSGVCGIILLVLALWLIIEAANVLYIIPARKESSASVTVAEPEQ